MCYSTESSLSAWVIANAIALYLFYRNRRYDRWNAGFIAVFTTIQLLEAGIWLTMEDSVSPVDNPSNELLTKMILLVLLMQPLSQAYLGAKATNASLLYYLSFIYLGVFLWALFFRVGTANPGEFYSSKGPQGHLVWHDSKSEANSGSFLGGDGNFSWLVGALYLSGLFIPLLFAKDYQGLPLLAIGGGTAVYSLFIAKSGEFASLWCYYAVLYAIVAVFV